MDTDLKAKWVAALRSGDYSQGKYALRTLEGYCCLGVLCDVVSPLGWDEGHCYTYGNSGSSAVLPADLTKLLFGSGCYDNDEAFEVGGYLPFEGRDNDHHLTLSSLNDSGQFTFDQIADIIEYAL